MMMRRYFSLDTTLRGNAVALAFAVFIGAPALLYMIPPSAMFEATVTVPDFRVGEDPNVEYVRMIKMTQRMGWDAEIHTLEHDADNGQICSGRGSNTYQVDEPWRRVMPLSDFGGFVRCELKPGTYYLDTCWSGHIAFMPKTYCARSNIFRVSP